MSATPQITERVHTGSPGTRIPEREDEKLAVREQLDRLLSSPLFKNSRRYPALLRYVVERVLEGHIDSLKERTLGIEVFHRDPNYDTNQDPVVRTTAVEVRKRLTQYYQEPGHEGELRIEFPSGSYLPEFRLAVAPTVATPVPDVTRRLRIAAKVAVPVAVGALALALLIWWSPWKPASALDRFWAPVWGSSDHVVICVGGSSDPAPVDRVSLGKDATQGSGSSLQDLFGRDERTPLAEVATVARILGQSITKGRPFRLRSHSNTKFDELREGPVILIGGFDNSWTVRLLDQLRLRFRLERDKSVVWIGDLTNPGQRNWVVDSRTTYSEVAEDYALISRVRDPSTGQVMVSVAGLTPFGTAAAGEFVSDPRYMEEALGKSGKPWKDKNIQIVVATRLTGANSGPPRVLATNIW
jgi:hypothetical protein